MTILTQLLRITKCLEFLESTISISIRQSMLLMQGLKILGTDMELEQRQ